MVLMLETFEKHLALLRKLINRITDAGLTMNRQKSQFCRREVKYLGFMIDGKGMRIDPDKTASVDHYPSQLVTIAQ